MSTAHRPTWHTAIGRNPGDSLNTMKVSSRDLPGHNELKKRQMPSILESDKWKGQMINDTKELKKILKAKLESSEHESRGQEPTEVPTNNFLSLEDGMKLLNQDINAFPEDEDDYAGKDTSDKEEQNEDSDEEQELLRELEKIKREKEERRQQEQREYMEKHSEELQQGILNKNPLLAPTSQEVAWDRDVVFKNPHREVKEKPKFVNDAVRSEFHKRFLQKYIA